MTLLRGGALPKAAKHVQQDALPVGILVQAGLADEEAVAEEGLTEEDLVTLPMFLKTFCSDADVDPSARTVAKAFFKLLVAEQRTELLSLPPEPAEALRRLQELEQTIVTELAERRRAQACMDAEEEEE